MKEWLKAHWKILAIAGAGVIGLYLLMQRSGGGAPAADAGPNLPPTGPPPQGNQTPGFFSPAEGVASGLAQELGNSQLLTAGSGITMFGAPSPTGVDKGGHQEYSYGTGAISKAWQQVVVGGQQMWEDIYHPGHIISEQQAQALSPQDSGPYAKGTPWYQKLLQGFQTAASAYLTVQTGVPMTPPIAPTPSFGNRPAPTQPGQIPDSHVTVPMG